MRKINYFTFILTWCYDNISFLKCYVQPEGSCMHHISNESSYQPFQSSGSLSAKHHQIFIFISMLWKIIIFWFFFCKCFMRSKAICCFKFLKTCLRQVFRVILWLIDAPTSLLYFTLPIKSSSVCDSWVNNMCVNMTGNMRFTGYINS